MQKSVPQLKIHSSQSRAQQFERTHSIFGKIFRGKMSNLKQQSSSDQIQIYKKPSQTLSLIPRPQTTMIYKKDDPKTQLPQRASTSHKTLRTPIIQEYQQQQMQIKQSSNKQIYYANAQYKNILQQNKFPNGIHSLKPNDKKCELVLAIIQKQFPEIEISEYNILICQHKTTVVFHVYFSDSEWVPFSKCCDVPVYILIYVEKQNLSIFCNKCDREMIDQKPKEELLFFRSRSNFNIPLIVQPQSPKQQRDLLKFSKIVMTGKFKYLNMQKLYRDNEIKNLKQQSFVPLRDVQEQSNNVSKKFTKLHDTLLDPKGNESTIQEIRNIIDAWID